MTSRFYSDVNPQGWTTRIHYNKKALVNGPDGPKYPIESSRDGGPWRDIRRNGYIESEYGEILVMMLIKALRERDRLRRALKRAEKITPGRR